MKPINYLFIAVTTVAAFVFLYHKNYDHSPEVVQQQKAKTKELFLGKRKIHSVPNVEDKTFPGCEELESTLNDLDFRSPPEAWITTLELRELDQCEDPALEIKLTDATQACFGKKINNNLCIQNLLFLRSLLRTRNELDANNPENVADMIIREFSSKKEPDFKKLNSYATKLLDLNPSNMKLQKFWATSMLMANIKNVSDELQDEIYSKIDPSLLQDPTLLPYRMFLETKLDPVKAESFSRDFMEQDPKNPQAREMLGWSLWQQGKKEEAIEQLRVAIAISPNDEYLQQMYKDIQSPKADRNAYKGRMQMGVSFEDLFD